MNHKEEIRKLDKINELLFEKIFWQMIRMLYKFQRYDQIEEVVRIYKEHKNK